MAVLNQIGACSQQIERRYVIVAEEIGHEPSQRELIKHDEKLFSIIKRR